jgi:hypothetical protein
VNPPRPSKLAKAIAEASALLRAPQRLAPLLGALASDRVRRAFQPRHPYSYTRTKRPSRDTLSALLAWISRAQRPDGGIAAYYSLLTGYSESYPEVTGYLVPTLYDFAHRFAGSDSLAIADRATRWLLSLQMPSGAFPGGLLPTRTQPSIFNTGQILQGLVRSYIETQRIEILQSALAAADWLLRSQQADGSWSGPYAYQDASHTYYSMVAWSLAELSNRTGRKEYGLAAARNLDWVLPQFHSGGWIDGINLRGHPLYLHFIAYVLQGVLEGGSLQRRPDAVAAVARSAWVLLRKFENGKFLCGAYDADFKSGRSFACLTGNAQISCVWLRLFELTRDIRYLNGALKMNELLKPLIPARGGPGVIGGVAGSSPIWGPYQPLRYISWGCKFFADALMLEDRLMGKIEPVAGNRIMPCAS